MQTHFIAQYKGTWPKPGVHHTGSRDKVVLALAFAPVTDEDKDYPRGINIIAERSELTSEGEQLLLIEGVRAFCLRPPGTGSSLRVSEARRLFATHACALGLMARFSRWDMFGAHIELILDGRGPIDEDVQS